MKVKLKDAFDLQIGRTPARSNAANWNGQYKWISITDLGTAGKYISTTKEKITDKGIDESGIKIVPKGTVVMSFKLSIGKTAITTEDMYTNEAIVAFNVRESIQVDSSYLYYLCCGNDWGEGTNKAVMGLTLNKATLSEKEIELPEIMIQREVAKKLDKLDKIIIQRKKQLQKLDELIQARFVEMFGDPVCNSHDLPEATLPELGEFGRGVSKHRPRNDSNLLGGRYPLIQTGDVATSELYITSYTNTYSELGLKQSKMWKKGTLCITIAATIAKTAILAFDACFPDSVVGFIANEKTNNVFVHYWFTFFQSILEAQAPESAQKNINLKILSELKIIVPKKELQDEFVTFVNQVNKSKVEIQQALEKTQLLFDSLMQQYFG